MLATLGKLKANTVAIERCVEWGGNIGALSVDARFAISNMTAEFGGVAGVFPADGATAAYISKRGGHNTDALYFRADPGATYAEKHVIDLTGLGPQVALFPSPDNVVPIEEVLGTRLDGCFIGACTTTEEDLILAALVLEAGLAAGLRPCESGKRRVTPGSVLIVERLRALGLADVYERAGFTVGAPGCSYCIGIAADKALEGEVWLTSQNRNYKNRMGKGSIANLASAATVAASSFGMSITDPRALLAQVDRARFTTMLQHAPEPAITISEPAPVLAGQEAPAAAAAAAGEAAGEAAIPPSELVVTGKVQVMGDNVDTDAIIPGEFLHLNDPAELGKYAFLHVDPEFRARVAGGATVIVAGKGFGCGSSREQAVTALQGAGVKAVVARSFSYIFLRNYLSLSLVGIQLTDERFYAAAAAPGAVVTVSMRARTVSVGGEAFPFKMSLFEERLLAGGGILPLYKKYGNRLFRVAVEASDDGVDAAEGGAGGCGSGDCSKDGSAAEGGKVADLSW